MKQLKGMDKFLMSLLVKMLKTERIKNEEFIETISNVENGFDGVKGRKSYAVACVVEVERCFFKSVNIIFHPLCAYIYTRRVRLL